jgi:hypothetical protein
MIELLNNELELEIEELEEEIIIIIEEYLENNIRKYSSPEFYEKMGEEIIDYMIVMKILLTNYKVLSNSTIP